MQPGQVNAGARLDRLPLSRFHRRILWLIGAGMFFDSFDIYLTGGVLGALVKSGWSSMALNASFISVTFIGVLIGSLAAGFLGDRFGRRFSYQTNLAIFGLASLAGAFAPSMNWLIVCRFVMGVGLGAEIVVGYATLTEFIPPEHRGRWAALLSLITNSAVFVATLLGYLILPSIGWRWMFVIPGIGALLVWVARKAMPESPRWLEQAGRGADAERVLAAIEQEIAAEYPATPLPAPSHGVALSERVGFTVLFARPVIRRTFVGITLNIVINMVIYGFVAWIPTFLVKQGLTINATLGYTTLMSLGGPVGAFAGYLLADRIGRKRGIVVVSVAAALLGAAYASASSIEMATIVGFALFVAIFLLVALAIAAYVPELFPTEYRLRGTGVCNTFGRVASILVPSIVVSLFGLGGVTYVLGLLIGLLILQAIIVGLFGVETNRHSLEELAPEPLGAVQEGTV
jgi:MFS transporter, putative metabolite:H+ symporter